MRNPRERYIMNLEVNLISTVAFFSAPLDSLASYFNPEDGSNMFLHYTSNRLKGTRRHHREDYNHSV
jgi:hypothetical protein